MAAQEVLEPSEPIKYKRWILKVSIHCEGCKRKVKKILQEVPGVFQIDVDVKQQRATVVGDVDADTLLRKLNKAGKHAELLPVKVEEQPKKQGKPKSEDKTTEEESNEGTSKAAKTPTVKEQVQEPSKDTQAAAGVVVKVSKSVVSGGGSAPKAQEPLKNNNHAGSATKPGGETGGAAKTSTGESSIAVKVTERTGRTCTVDQVVKESKLEEKKPGNDGGATEQPPVAAEEKGDDNDATTATNSAGKVDGNDGGNTGKKKKKKGQNGKKVEGEQSSAAPASIGSQNYEGGPPTGSVPPNYIPPHHPSHYAYPPHYYGPPPAYAVSYNTSHPTSHTASYYAAQPPDSYVYAYSGYPGVPEREAPPPPSDLSTYPRQPLDSFEIFSDENPNGCSIM